MKKCLLFVMVCLMATGAYASQSWVGPTGSWGTASLWQNSVLPSDATSGGEIKIIKTSATSCNLDVAAGSFSTTKVTVSGNGGLTLNILSGGSILIGKEMAVGNGTAGSGVPTGIVKQTGGTVTLNDTGAVNAGKLEIGYKTGTAGVGNGTYTISGGTINGTGGIYVGAFAGTGTGGTSSAIGKMVVQGTGGTISVGSLAVGVGDVTGFYTGTGTLEYQLNNGVSAITSAGAVIIDPVNQAAAIANLLVSATNGPIANVVLLINNNSGTAVTGVFDAVNGVTGGNEGTKIDFGGMEYLLTYVYNAAGGDGIANDVALVLVPEPVTIALLGLGFLAMRRRK
jgi:hypothetical protein